MGQFSQGEPRKAVTGSPLPGLKEFFREPWVRLLRISLYAREKPMQKPEGRGDNLLKMRAGHRLKMENGWAFSLNLSQGETAVSIFLTIR